MTSGLAALVLQSAAKIGAPIIRSILQDKLGGAGGVLADVVLEKVAGKAGVSLEELPTLSQTSLDVAVRSVEREGPEIILAHLEAHREMNRVQLAELEKSEGTWTWAWRPAWMWLLGFLWVYALVFQPLIKAALIPNLGIIDTAILMGVTGVFVTFYMGGHTYHRGRCSHRVRS